MNKIGKICLRNQGGFVVKLEFTYIDGNGNKIRKKGTGDITIGFSKTADPGDYGVPDGAMVSIFCNVVWGCDNQGNEIFLYQKGDNMIANYVITGTTLSNSLGFTGFSTANDAMAANVLPQDYANLSNDQMTAIKNDLENPALGQSGSWGPISWDVNMHFDPGDIRKSFLDARIGVFGINIINGRLDINNPEIGVDLTVAGVGVKAALGINFNLGEVYLKGSLNFVFYSKDFNLTILKF